MNLNEFRRSYIKLDKASQSYITPQYVKQGDYNGRELIVQITDGGAVKDMTGVSLELGWKHESIQNAGLEPFSELDVTQGLFKVAYPTELLNPGRVLCAIRVSENGTVTNSMNFSVVVEKNPFDDTALVSDNAFTVLESVTTGAQLATTDANNAAQAANDAAQNANDAAESTKIERKSPVDSFADLATVYPDAELGWAVYVRNAGTNGEVYRFDGTDWQLIEEFDGTVINEVDSRLSAQLADKAYQTNVNPIGTPRIVGHRGLSGIAPENTIPSYVLAGRHGIWAAETDIQRTSDGVWVLMHDYSVDRTTDGSGNVKDMTLAQIKALKIDVGVNIGLYPNLRVPTLEEFLTVCKQYNMVPLLEVKSVFNAEDCLDLVNVLKRYNFEEQAIVLSADLLILWEIRKHSMRLHTQYLSTISSTSLMHVVNMGNASINAEFSTLTKAHIEQAHEAGVSVNTWTVNSYEKARELFSWGLDVLSTDVITEVKF